jgi:hypothetical protein
VLLFEQVVIEPGQVADVFLQAGVQVLQAVPGAYRPVDLGDADKSGQAGEPFELRSTARTQVLDACQRIVMGGKAQVGMPLSAL